MEKAEYDMGVKTGLNWLRFDLFDDICKHVNKPSYGT
jgi:hypothetical protein